MNGGQSVDGPHHQDAGQPAKSDAVHSAELVAAVVVPNGDDAAADVNRDENLLAIRRQKDRQRYAAMNPVQRKQYNAKRREQYHKQSEESRKRRRDRERTRYHSLGDEEARLRNARRARLERQRYARLTKKQLTERNGKRRERAATVKRDAAMALPPMPDENFVEAVAQAAAAVVAAETEASGHSGNESSNVNLPETHVMDEGEAAAPYDEEKRIIVAL